MLDSQPSAARGGQTFGLSRILGLLTQASDVGLAAFGCSWDPDLRSGPDPRPAAAGLGGWTQTC